MTGEELKKLRKKLGYSLRDFGEKVGLSHVLISYYEKGTRFISENKEKQILMALGISFDEKKDHQLRVHLDYLRITFFDSKVEVIMNYVLGIQSEYFDFKESKAKNYEGIYECGAIKIYVSTLMKQGLLLELSGQALMELEEHLAEYGLTLNDWLIRVTDEDYYLKKGLYSRIQSSRLDTAIDEVYNEVKGNYDLHELKSKVEHPEKELISTRLAADKSIEANFRGEPQGLSLYWGSSNGHFLIRMYEKAKERAKKERKDYDMVLEEYGVVNRYELQLREHYAEHVIEELARGVPLQKISIDLLLSKIEVYDEIIKNDEVEYVFSERFYNVFGVFKKIKVNGKKTETSIERSMRWVETQVIGTLKMLREIFGKQWLYEWLELCMSKVDFSENQKNIINGEMARLDKKENSVFLYWSEEIAKEKEKEKEKVS
ncbi:replication initiation factor domain-containing protein [Carnobacterium maltaromaticum]|nr:replication initiation factor domain-containing protein [Carnobacterium maltaromaticum]